VVGDSRRIPSTTHACAAVIVRALPISLISAAVGVAALQSL
jgi:hypothetical protein